MTNFIFKSQETYKKFANTLEVILNEQRHQRGDLASINATLKYIIKIMNHQDTLDYFSKKYGEDLGKTTPGQSTLDEKE